MQNIESNRAYTADEVAELLQVSVITVARRLKSGDIKGRKMGAFWRILGQDLIDYLRGGNNETRNTETP